MVDLLFSDEQNKLFEKLRTDKHEDLVIWSWINVAAPCGIILLPLLFLPFIPKDKAGFQDLILNGSFSLLGISILFSASVFLIRSIRTKDAKFEKQIVQVRTRLMMWLISIVLLESLLYWCQITYPLDTPAQYSVVILLFLPILLLSIAIGKRIYIVRDELVGIPFDEDVNDQVNEFKAATNDIK